MTAVVVANSSSISDTGDQTKMKRARATSSEETTAAVVSSSSDAGDQTKMKRGGGRASTATSSEETTAAVVSSSSDAGDQMKMKRGGGRASSTATSSEETTAVVVNSSSDAGDQTKMKRGGRASSTATSSEETTVVVVNSSSDARGGPIRAAKKTTNQQAPDRAIAAAVVSTNTQSVQQLVIPEFPQPLRIDAVLLSCFGFFEPELMAMLEHFFAIHLNPQLADSLLVKSLHVLSYQLRSAVDVHRAVYSDFQGVNRHIETLNAGNMSLEEGNKQLRVSNNIYFHIIIIIFFHVYPDSSSKHWLFVVVDTTG
jgi:hypothetical protein